MTETVSNNTNTDKNTPTVEPAGFSVSRNGVTLDAVTKSRRGKGDEEGTKYIGFEDITKDNLTQMMEFYGEQKFLRLLNNKLNATWQGIYENACKCTTGEKDAEGNELTEDCDFQQSKFIEDVTTLHDRTWEGESKADLLKKREVKLAEYSDFIGKFNPVGMSTEGMVAYQTQALEYQNEIKEIESAIQDRSRKPKAKATA